MAGETGPFHVSLPIAMTMAGFFAISCYNTIEIFVMIYYTFKRHRSLYFWSMVVASCGILVHAVAQLLRYFRLAPNFPMCVITVAGWWAMVTGQSVMLYSRLHLVTSNERMIRCVLLMIITNVCILHFPTTVLFFGSNLASPKPFVKPFIVYEKIQLMGFCIQESIISALYIWETIHVLRPVLTIKGPRERTVIWHLVFVNGLVVLLDVSLVATEYTNHFDIQTTYKPVVYSIKLKMEFIVLNRLLSIIQDRSGTRSCCRGSCCYAIARPTLYRSNGLTSMAIQSSSDHTDIKPPSTAKLNPCSMPLPEPPEHSAGTACVDMHRELVETESIELLRYHAQMSDLGERGSTDTQAQYGGLRVS